MKRAHLRALLGSVGRSRSNPGYALRRAMPGHSPSRPKRTSRMGYPSIRSTRTATGLEPPRRPNSAIRDWSLSVGHGRTLGRTLGGPVFGSLSTGDGRADGWSRARGLPAEPTEFANPTGCACTSQSLSDRSAYSARSAGHESVPAVQVDLDHEPRRPRTGLRTHRRVATRHGRSRERRAPHVASHRQVSADGT